MERKGQLKAQEILSSYPREIFTDKQYDCLTKRAEGQTFQQIGDSKGLTKQAIYASWQGILNKTK